jgi:tungstate transport system substrate-binding protein
VARTRHLRFRLTAVVVAAVLVSFTGCGRPQGQVVLATTTSVGNSGLLDAVLPRYAMKVSPVLVGSGRALDMLESGQADVIISHAPRREQQALEAHPDWWYRKILFNDFLIVGPVEDPARISSARSAVEAMRLIAASGSVFLSRGDESGTHERERELWTAAGRTPEPRRLVIAGAGMGQTLRVASSTGAYTLTDRGTFETLRGSLALKPIFEGDPVLLNTYAVIADPQRPAGLAFARWLNSEDGRRTLMAALEEGRVKGFSLWPAATPGERPDSLPRAP